MTRQLRDHRIFLAIVSAGVIAAIAVLLLWASHRQDQHDFARLQGLLCDQESAFASLPQQYDKPQTQTGQQLVDVALKIQATGQVIHFKLHCQDR